jgi:hypothetical protein
MHLAFVIFIFQIVLAGIRILILLVSARIVDYWLPVRFWDLDY